MKSPSLPSPSHCPLYDEFIGYGIKIFLSLFFKQPPYGDGGDGNYFKNFENKLKK